MARHATMGKIQNSRHLRKWVVYLDWIFCFIEFNQLLWSTRPLDDLSFSFPKYNNTDQTFTVVYIFTGNSSSFRWPFPSQKFIPLIWLNDEDYFKYLPFSIIFLKAISSYISRSTYSRVRLAYRKLVNRTGYEDVTNTLEIKYQLCPTT